MTKRRTGLVVATLVSGVLLAACSSGTADTKPRPAATRATTTTAKRGTATITTFTVPTSVQCAAAPNITFTVGYAVTGAKTVQLLVDGRDNPGLTPAGGNVVVPVHCDAIPHTVVLVALDDQGGQTVQQKTVTTVLPK